MKMKKILFGIVICLFVLCSKDYVYAASSVTGKAFFKMLNEAAQEHNKQIDFAAFLNELRSGKKLTLSDVSRIVAGVLVQFGEDMPTDSKSKYILTDRLSLDDNVSDADAIYLAQLYSKGLIKGDSIGTCCPKRSINSSEPIGKKEAKGIISRLFNENQRYRLTEDYQLIRIDTASYPKFSDYYSYILEDYPNEYYDTVFNFMVNQAVPENALTNRLWKKYGCTTYKNYMTWDTAFSKIPYSARRNMLLNYDSKDRLGIYSSYIFPHEYDKFAKWRNKKTGYLGMPLTADGKQEMADGAADFVMHALNVDYRTIDKDLDWQDFMLKQNITVEELHDYISECKKDELIIECSFAAADKSAVYFDRTPFTFKFCEGVVRVYAQYRIVNDNGKAFDGGNLSIGLGGGRECLRDTTIDEAGERYIAIRNDKLQEGYFDIGVLGNGNVVASMINNLRYRCPYIAVFGYPCEFPVNYPGTYTVKGMITHVRKGISFDKYMEKWGYLY